MIAKLLTALVGVAHLYFGHKEIVDWEDFGPKLLGEQPQGFFESTTALAANQGTYNLFLGVGLLLAILGVFKNGSRSVALYLLGCVAVAGIVGLLTIGGKLFLIAQIGPAIIAAVICLLYWPTPTE